MTTSIAEDQEVPPDLSISHKQVRIYPSDAGEAFLFGLAAVLVGLDDGLIYYITEVAEVLFGYSVSGDLLGKPIETLVPEAKRERHVVDRTAYSVNPQPRSMGNALDIVQGQRRDGSVFPAAVSLGKSRVISGVRMVPAIITEIPLPRNG